MKKQRYRYTIAHEYGHMRDTAYETLEDAKGTAEGAIYRNKRSELASSKNIRGDVLGVRGNGISHYGLSKKRGSFGFITDEINDRETYAESYAEWSVNNGKTGNKASKAFAREFNWAVNTDQFKEVPTGPASSIGERIVRTAEGKERYGVSIGQKIPKDKEAASAMGSVELVSIAAIKLVNSEDYTLAALELEK